MLRQSGKLCTHAFFLFVEFFITCSAGPLNSLAAFVDKGVTKCPSPTAALLSQSLTNSEH